MGSVSLADVDDTAQVTSDVKTLISAASTAPLTGIDVSLYEGSLIIAAEISWWTEDISAGADPPAFIADLEDATFVAAMFSNLSIATSVTVEGVTIANMGDCSINNGA
eukprot:gene8081-9600_t